MEKRESARRIPLGKALIAGFSAGLVALLGAAAISTATPSASAGEIEYGETYMNELMDVDSRGCNACHGDLGELINTLGYTEHMAASGGTYGKEASWNDCFRCHSGNQYGGAVIKDTIHSIHYANEAFVDGMNGTCFSCHALNNTGDWVMWEFYRASEQFGGFKKAGSPALVDEWVGEGYRNHPNDTIAGVAIDNEMDVVVVDVNQDPTSADELFAATNHVPCEFLGNEDAWSLTLTGVKNPTTFTLADLQAMAQSEDLLLHACFANAIGSYQVANIPVTGVLLQDLVDACGGLEDGVTAATLLGADKWGWPYTPYDLSLLLDNDAMIVLEYWGEPMSELEGYPAVLAIPGIPAGAWIKYIETIDFTATPGVSEFWYSIFKTPVRETIYTDLGSTEFQGGFGFGCPATNAGFFTPCDDGEVLTMVDGKVTLSGYAYVWGHAGHALDQLAFSSDYGNTWTYIDLPEDLDPTKMATWTAEWTPEAPGTYVLYLAASDVEAGWQNHTAFVTVVVE